MKLHYANWVVKKTSLWCRSVFIAGEHSMFKTWLRVKGPTAILNFFKQGKTGSEKYSTKGAVNGREERNG